MRNSDLRIAETLISYDKFLLTKINRNGKSPLDLAILFHNERMRAFICDVLKFEYKIPTFETLYLKFSEPKDINEKQAVTDQVVLLLSEKMEQCETEQQDEEGEEEEDTNQDQYMNEPNIMYEKNI